jgi:glucose/arabinose dehydrogenase
VTSFDVSGAAARDERRVADGFKLPLGLLVLGEELYVSDNGTVWRLRGTERTAIVSGIPVFEHATDGMALGPDGKIYLGAGSTCNACKESDPRNATIARFRPDGAEFEIVARGLRNPYDLAFHPADGSLWATDNGRDDLGAEVPDELDLIQPGKHYGYPDCYGRGRGSNCDGTVAAVLELESNSAAGGLHFYSASSFPAEYRHNAFVALWGSFRRTRGRKVVRVVLVKREGRYAARAVDFASGFDAPLDLVVSPADGALYVADHGRGTLYRIRWRG